MDIADMNPYPERLRFVADPALRNDLGNPLAAEVEVENRMRLAFSTRTSTEQDVTVCPPSLSPEGLKGCGPVWTNLKRVQLSTGDYVAPPNKAAGKGLGDVEVYDAATLQFTRGFDVETNPRNVAFDRMSGVWMGYGDYARSVGAVRVGADTRACNRK